MSDPYTSYDLESLKQYLNEIVELINNSIFDLNKNKLEIKGYELVQEASMNIYHKGFYRSSERMIKLHLELGITVKEITETFLHELTHAYQHQIIPSYYSDIIRETTNQTMHDDVFFKIFERFKKVLEEQPIKNVILYSNLSQGNKKMKLNNHICEF